MLCEGPYGVKVWSFLFFDARKGSLDVAIGYLGAEFEDSCCCGIRLGEGGGVEVEDSLILALMESVVDGQEFCPVFSISMEKIWKSHRLITHLLPQRTDPWSTIHLCVCFVVNYSLANSH